MKGLNLIELYKQSQKPQHWKKVGDKKG